MQAGVSRCRLIAASWRTKASKKVSKLCSYLSFSFFSLKKVCKQALYDLCMLRFSVLNHPHIFAQLYFTCPSQRRPRSPSRPFRPEENKHPRVKKRAHFHEDSEQNVELEGRPTPRALATVRDSDN